MVETMTPSSSITDGQIDKAGDVVRAVVCKNLREHRSEFVSETVQQILGSPAFGHKALAVFRQMYEAASGMVVRHVKKINRGRTPQEMLDDLGRAQYTDHEVVDAMPRGEGEEGDVHFFQASRYISDDELEKEFESRGFVPADPYKVAAVNQDDPEFGDEHPNATHWKDSQGRWCYLACRRSDDERRVIVSRYDDDWFDGWWFAGVHAVHSIIDRVYPSDGVEFELTFDFDAPEADPIAMVQSDGYGSPEKWRFTGQKLSGIQTRRFKLVRKPCRNLDEVLSWYGVTEGQWREAFKAAYPKPDGNGPIGFADPSWVNPSGHVNFPFVDSGGDSHFRWAGHGLGESWRWLVPASK